MEKKYSKKEHDKCQRVADAFSELYEMYGDMCVVDAGKFAEVRNEYLSDAVKCLPRA